MTEPEPIEPSRLLAILSDQPAAEDQLNFAPYAKTLADIMADPGTDTPLTIGAFGGWGQGKTSLMRMVERQLNDTAGTAFPVRAVWFNAWLYSQQPALWRALISRVLAGVQGFTTLSDSAWAGLRQLEVRLYGVSPAAGAKECGPAAPTGPGTITPPGPPGRQRKNYGPVRYGHCRRGGERGLDPARPGGRPGRFSPPG